MNELDDDYAYVNEKPGPKWKFNKNTEPKPQKVEIVANYEELYNLYPKVEKDGLVYLVVNASKFADTHGINRTYMNKLLNGAREEAGGFRVRK